MKGTRMQATEEVEKEAWFDYLEEGQKALVKDAYRLLGELKAPRKAWQRGKQNSKLESFSDYSFVVVPMAKAYEGFLKKFLFELGLIEEHQYRGDHFRIGKALNPDLPERFRDEDWVWDDVANLCGREVADKLWLSWRDGRNRLVHFFPHHKQALSFLGAEEAIEKLRLAMAAAVSCGRRRRNKQV